MDFRIGFVELARVSVMDEAVEQLEEVLEVAELRGRRKVTDGLLDGFHASRAWRQI